MVEGTERRGRDPLREGRAYCDKGPVAVNEAGTRADQ
jgi:hypothetical protein